MSKNLLLSLGVTSLLLTGCAMDPISYNNFIVDHSDETLRAWESSYSAYLYGVPQEVNPGDTIDLVGMQAAYDTLSPLVMAIETDLLIKESRDKEQEAAVQASLINVAAAGKDYLIVYQEILDYYGGDFGSNLDNVAILDTKLYEVDDVWVEAHNTLVDVLAVYPK